MSYVHSYTIHPISIKGLMVVRTPELISVGRSPAGPLSLYLHTYNSCLPIPIDCDETDVYLLTDDVVF